MPKADGWHVRDCGSRFGTFLNDQKIEDALIRPGDRLRVGQTRIQLVDEAVSRVLSGSGTFELRQMNALLASLRAMGSARVLDEVLAIVLDCALEVTGAERGFILLADSGKKDGRTLALTLTWARGGITLPSAQTSQLIPEAVFATGVDQIVTDLRTTSSRQLISGP